MKAVEEIRRANLNALVAEAGNAARLAALTGVPAPYISQVRRGVQHNKTGKPREMGTEVARRLETKMGKPRGWMDVYHSAIDEGTDITGREGQLLGLFRILSAAEQADLINDLTRRLRRGQPAGLQPSDGLPKH